MNKLKIGILNTNHFPNSNKTKVRPCDIRYAIYLASKIEIVTPEARRK